MPPLENSKSYNNNTHYYAMIWVPVIYMHASNVQLYNIMVSRQQIMEHYMYSLTT